MTYILIVMWFGVGSSYSGKAALAVEFDDLESCRAAAAEIRKQEWNERANVGTVLCARKGKAR